MGAWRKARLKPGTLGLNPVSSARAVNWSPASHMADGTVIGNSASIAQWHANPGLMETATLSMPDRYQDPNRWRVTAVITAVATIAWSALAAFVGGKELGLWIVLAVIFAAWTGVAVRRRRQLLRMPHNDETFR